MSTLDAITLPSDLLWIDEYAHTPVVQKISPAVDGSLVIEVAAQIAGRPITLQGGNDYAWVTKATLEQLRIKQYLPGLTMVLNHNGANYSVIFQQPNGIEATPIIDYSNPDPGDFYAVTLRFIEI
jgi:hypothetical protein